MTITKSGELASFYTVNKAPIKHLKVYFSPKQAGTGDPSPDNVREISGWNNITAVHTGKNLIISDDPTNLEKTYTHTSTGSTLYDASTQSVYSQGNGVSLLRHWNAQMNTAGSNCLFIAPDDITVSYSINISHDNTQDFTSWPIRLMKNDEQWSYYRRDKDSSASNLCHKRENVQLSKNDCLTGTFYGGVYWKNLQIEIGPEATKYEPYRGHTYPIDWSSTLGTIYGGYVDLVTGELIQTHKCVTITGNEGYTYIKFNTGLYSGATIFNDSKKGEYISGYCSVQPSSSGKINFLVKANVDYGIQFNEVTTYWGLEEQSSAALIAKLQEWNNAGTPLQIVYELKTPITHQLTPTQLSTLIGRNNIWSNADRVEVEYDLAESNDELYRRRNILMRSAPHIETASGNIAHFETDITAPIKSAIVRFEPVQEGEGTPSPENIREISGWNGIDFYHYGKNLVNDKKFFHGNNGNSYIIDSEDNQYHSYLKAGRYRLKGEIKNGGNYYFNQKRPSASAVTLTTSFQGNKNMLFTLPADDYYRFNIYSANGVLAENIGDVMISVPADDSDYEPFCGTITPIDWQTAVGTIYGGYVDLVSGELVATHLVEEENGHVFSFTGTAAYQFGHTPCCPNDAWWLSLCSHWKTTKFANENFAWINVNGAWFIGREVFEAAGVPFNNEGLQAWLSSEKQKGTPIQLGGPLVTPIHYQLTPTQLKSLRGINNIWSNANGPIEVKYWRH